MIVNQEDRYITLPWAIDFDALSEWCQVNGNYTCYTAGYVTYTTDQELAMFLLRWVE